MLEELSNSDTTVRYTNPSGGYSVPKPQGKTNYRKARARTMERGIAQDLRQAGDVSAKRQILSGAIKELPGDVDSTHFTIEAKNYAPIETNAGRMIRIDLQWLTKVMKEGRDQGKPGLLVYQPKGAHSKFVVMDYQQFLELMDKFTKATQ